MRISVLLATCDRPERLARTLEAIRVAVAAAGGGHPVIVADNGPNQPARDAVDAARARGLKDVTHLPCPPRDRCKALNSAVRAADTDWLAFTDDDTLPDAAWLVRAAEFAAAGGCRVFGGRVVPEESQGPLPRWMTPGRAGRASSHVIFVRYAPRNQSGLLQSSDPVPFGANMFIRKEVFAQHGPFDERLYPLLGRAALGGDDTEFLVRVRSRGEPIGYCHEALIRHPVHYERARVREQVRLAYEFGWREPFVFFEANRPLTELYRFPMVLRWLGRLARDSVLGDSAAAVDDVLKLARCAGEIKARWSRAYRTWAEGHHA